MFSLLTFFFPYFLHIIQVKRIVVINYVNKASLANTCQLCGRVFKTNCDIYNHLKKNYFFFFLLTYNIDKSRFKRFKKEACFM